MGLPLTFSVNLWSYHQHNQLVAFLFCQITYVNFGFVILNNRTLDNLSKFGRENEKINAPPDG